MAENLSARYGRNIGTFWKGSEANRQYHAPPLGWRSGVGADGKEYGVVQFDDDVDYADNQLVWFKEVAAESWRVTNDRSASTGVPAGVLHVPAGTSAPEDGYRGFIQIKGETEVLKEAAAINTGTALAGHATVDGSIENTAPTTVAHMLNFVGYAAQDAAAGTAAAPGVAVVRLALPWA